MPVMTRTRSIWPTRVQWPRRGEGILPTLATLPREPLAYVRGRSRFAISPLHLTLDQLLFLVTASLLAIGLVMVQSADARVRAAAGSNWLVEAFVTKNAIHAALALIVMTLVWRADYRRLLGKSIWMSPATWLVVLILGCLAAVLVTPLGKDINGARRWLALGPLGFQPSELAKLGLVLFIAAYAVHREREVKKFWKGFVPLIAAFGVVAVLIVKEDFGTTALIAAVCFVLMFMAGCRWWHLAMLIPPAAAGAYELLWHSPFRRARLLAFMDPTVDPKGVGYHPLQSLLTIISGGFWGRGLGNGIQKMGYLPENNTDFIFAVICEELGFFGALIVVLLFATFVMVGWRIACRCNNLFGKMVAFGITAFIGLQAAMNIAVVTVSMPTKGIALPLISSGGTGWIMMAMAIGVLMSIERVNRLEAEVERYRLLGEAPTMGFPVVAKTAVETASTAASAAKGAA